MIYIHFAQFVFQYRARAKMELLCLMSLLLSHLTISVISNIDSDPRTMRTIFNFNSGEEFSDSDIESWWESSDTVRCEFA